MQALPVQTQSVTLSPVEQSSDFVATIKSRRSVTVMPQVDGNLTQILVKSGDHVRAGQVMMEIDTRRQQALVDAQKSTENQKKALYDYNELEIERQRKLFEAGVTSREMLDLWDLPVVLLLALGLRAAEWLLRRKWGVV